jgi:hypothetical protein
MFEPDQLYELGAVAGIILAIGAVLAFALTKTASIRRERRHRKLSAGCRDKNTYYNLFGVPDAAENSSRVHSGRSKKRRRRSNSPRLVIDILKHDETEQATSSEEAETVAPEKPAQ